MDRPEPEAMPIGPMRHIGAALLQIVSYAGSVLIGIAAFFASAFLFDSPAILAIIGLMVGAMIVAIGSLLVGKLWRLRRLKIYVAGQIILLLMVNGLLAYYIFQPLVPEVEQFVPQKDEGTEYWELSTGSNIAVRRYESAVATSKPPIIILHGGPGAYSVSFKPMINVYSKLADDGYDVYLYDQIGSGLSARLQDISQYSLDRHIADLRSVQRKIGADQVILIGSSWGATLASNYLARYPTQVARVIFSGPGPIYLPDWPRQSDGKLDDKMNAQQKQRLDANLEKPRLFAAIFLAEINPVAALKFAPDREMGSFFDQIANRHYLPLAFCDPIKNITRSDGYGFWSSRMTGKTLLNRTDDPKANLKKNSVPVLILRGTCDYKTEAVAQQYASVFPNALFITVQGAGHMIYGEKPSEYLKLVRAFLE
ncbi:MAG: alpha/beta hydrolase [Parasphingorhabdus sp.]|uniref:alpha/beta hydrolase n=1 Tax=Parasphingorhabdus sp. TaxID=2709688 RepID=UPI00329748AD